MVHISVHKFIPIEVGFSSQAIRGDDRYPQILHIDTHINSYMLIPLANYTVKNQ